MDFGYTAEQRRWRERAATFAAQRLCRESTAGFSRERWLACAELGVPGLAIPTEYGGHGADPLTVAAVYEALGAAGVDSGLLFALGAHLFSCALPIHAFGTDLQRRRYLPGLCDGSLIGGHAVTEPDAGSDAFGLTTTAVPDGDAVVLTGRKAFVTNAPVADVFVVFATADPARGFAGISTYLVERGAAGLRVGPPIDKMGLPGAVMAELELDGCRVPATSRLGPAGGGMAVFSRAMLWERSLILAAGVGAMAGQLDRCVRHAQQRTQFGRPIGEFQAVAHRIAQMKVRLETARLALYRQAWLLGTGDADPASAALTKLHLSECLVANGLDALQIHGGAGYLAGSDPERAVRDALASRVYSGTSEIQREIIARGLGL